MQDKSELYESIARPIREARSMETCISRANRAYATLKAAEKAPVASPEPVGHAKTWKDSINAEIAVLRALRGM